MGGSSGAVEKQPRIPSPGPRRIHVIGGPGMGKTSLVQRLAERLGIPGYDVDAIGYVDKTAVARPLELRLADIRRIAAEPRWITETSHLRWTDPLLNAADLIIWLDHLPWFVASLRQAWRYLQLGFGDSSGHLAWRKLLYFHLYPRYFSTLVDFVVEMATWSLPYYWHRAPSTRAGDMDDRANDLATTTLYLRPYQDKLLHCRSREDLEGVIHLLIASNTRLTRDD